MSSPSGITMPDFDLINSAACIVKVGSTVFGQVRQITPRATTETEKVARVGDTAKSTVYKGVESSLALEVFAQKTLAEVALLLGVERPTPGGWTGTEVIKLDPTIAPFDVTIEVYDAATGSGDTLQGVLTVKNFKPTTWEFPIGADSNLVHTLDGECDSFEYVPEDESP